MLRELPVTDLMVTDVITFTADQNVQDAMRILVTEDIDAGPVVDENDHVVGLFSTGDVIVEEARLHLPTIVNFLGVNVALPWHDKELDESVAKALGEFVGEVMTAPADHHRPRRHHRGRRHADARPARCRACPSSTPPAGSSGSSPAATSCGRSCSASTSPTRPTPLPDDELTEMLEAAGRVDEADADDEQG